MAKIELKEVAHTYHPQAEQIDYALKPFSITWNDGHRYAVLGPSGCGKTTMLNIMSGIVTPFNGRILFDGVDVTQKPTASRNIAQVFQFPVIYHTMTVEQNLAFPLICRKVSRDIIKKKVYEVAETLNLHHHLTKSAKKLTADHKQLISLGRGLVRDEVSAILMDEPLTVIDPDLKFRLRRTLKEINEKYKTTLIYVTHDQNEAMTFAENIVVMDHGSIVQSGSPKELFEKPHTTFVAYFIGSPAMNMYSCSIENNNIKLGQQKLKLDYDLNRLKSNNIKLGIRSEFITLGQDQQENTIACNIKNDEDFGNYRLLTCHFDDLEIKVKINRKEQINADTISLHLPPDKCCLYENDVLVN